MSATGTAPGLPGTASLVRENTFQQGLIISSLHTSERIITSLMGFHGNSELTFSQSSFAVAVGSEAGSSLPPALSVLLSQSVSGTARTGTPRTPGEVLFTPRPPLDFISGLL